MTQFGNTRGPIFPLGKVVVTTAHTPVSILGNVTIPDVTPPPFDFVKVQAPSGNAGDVYLVFKGQAANAGNGTSVVLCIPKGQERELQPNNSGTPFAIDQFYLDADNNGDGAYITCLVC